MAGMTPDQVAASWAQRLGAAGDKAKAGAQAVTVSPGQAAARQRQVWLANLQANADKWAKNVSAVTTEQWQDAYINKGIPRIATGAQQAQSQMTDFFGKLLPYIDQQKKTLPARGTFEQNKARATAWMDKMHGFSYKGGQ